MPIKDQSVEDNSADAERLAHLKTRRFVDLVRSAEMLAKQRNGNFGYAEKKIFNAICRTTGDERCGPLIRACAERSGAIATLVGNQFVALPFRALHCPGDKLIRA